MRVIRKGCFETNSSSTHAICLSGGKGYDKDEYLEAVVNTTDGESVRKTLRIDSSDIVEVYETQLCYTLKDKLRFVGAVLSATLNYSASETIKANAMKAIRWLRDEAGVDDVQIIGPDLTYTGREWNSGMFGEGIDGFTSLFTDRLSVAVYGRDEGFADITTKLLDNITVNPKHLEDLAYLDLGSHVYLAKVKPDKTWDRYSRNYNKRLMTNETDIASRYSGKCIPVEVYNVDAFMNSLEELGVGVYLSVLDKAMLLANITGRYEYFSSVVNDIIEETGMSDKPVILARSHDYWSNRQWTNNPRANEIVTTYCRMSEIDVRRIIKDPTYVFITGKPFYDFLDHRWFIDMNTKDIDESIRINMQLWA